MSLYVKLVEALCAEHQINLIKVDDNKKLEEWVGLCNIDREEKPCKVAGCSCVVVKDYGKESQAKDVIEEYFKCKKWWNKKTEFLFLKKKKKNTQKQKKPKKQKIQVLSPISCMAWSSYLAFLYFNSPTFKLQIKDHCTLKEL